MQENLEAISKQLEDESTSMLEIVKDKNTNSNRKERLIFFVKQGLDNFLGDIIEGLSREI